MTDWLNQSLNSHLIQKFGDCLGIKIKSPFEFLIPLKLLKVLQIRTHCMLLVCSTAMLRHCCVWTAGCWGGGQNDPGAAGNQERWKTGNRYDSIPFGNITQIEVRVCCLRINSLWTLVQVMEAELEFSFKFLEACSNQTRGIKTPLHHTSYLIVDVCANILSFLQDPKRHLEEHVDVLMTSNIVQCLAAMLDTVVFQWLDCV